MKICSSYWSNTKLANHIRGTRKLAYGTGDEWNEWEKLAVNNHPFRYWLVEKGFDKAQNFFYYPLDILYDLTYWFNIRFIDKSHTCRAVSNPVEWHDTDSRIMHGLFGELCWFVEEKKAWMYFMRHHNNGDDDAEATSLFQHIPFWKHRWPFRHFTNFKYPVLGLKFLEWEMSIMQDKTWFGYQGDAEMLEEEKAMHPEFGQLTHVNGDPNPRKTGGEADF
jgi:hypothetical protein